MFTHGAAQKFSDSIEDKFIDILENAHFRDTLGHDSYYYLSPAAGDTTVN